MLQLDFGDCRDILIVPNSSAGGQHEASGASFLLLTAMSGAYGVSFPTAGTPYPTAGSYGAPSPTSTQQQVQIQPGSITYTTSTTSDGQIQYNQFRYANIGADQSSRSVITNVYIARQS